MGTAATATGALSNPFLTLPPSPPAARGLTEQDFSALYSAAAFAEAFDLIFDTSITLAWQLMGPEIEANAPTHFTTFLKCLRDWLTSRHLPLAWVYCHEYSPLIGLHTHIILYVPGVIRADRLPVATFIRLGEFLPGRDYIPVSLLDPPAPKVQFPWSRVDYRGEFRTWARGWAAHQMGRCHRAIGAEFARRPSGLPGRSNRMAVARPRSGALAPALRRKSEPRTRSPRRRCTRRGQF